MKLHRWIRVLDSREWICRLNERNGELTVTPSVGAQADIARALPDSDVGGLRRVLSTE
ncbi:hypothetical protein HUT19_03115 [Streptomyces sp. NA02950]|uniref:hypothetical protein n=1 Tax=Streptomyces sp. NA02950 TaxID=2742137 RepID=UPI00158FE87F|nr:hypothetical protein [Streptomyces sp. NA02950]QKV90852.1 hypothetical protein HUT19_03115 [Streptomyces sp. NA02950]